MVTVSHLTATELSRMRTTQDSAMQDVCRIGVYQENRDTYGNPDTSSPEDLWHYGEEQACGLEHVRNRETQSSGDVPVIDARLRLPIDVDVGDKDRVRIEQRYGEALTVAQVFEIEGPVRRGPSGLVLGLRLVDDGTGTPME